MSQVKYIHAGKIYDSNSGKYHSNKTIIISENFISSIEDGFINPKNDKIELIDLNILKNSPIIDVKKIKFRIGISFKDKKVEYKS